MKLNRKSFLLGIFLTLVAVFCYAGTPITLQKSIVGRTTTALAGNATYTTGILPVGEYGRVTLLAFADQNSATNGVKIQQTGDASCNVAGATPNWDYESTYTLTASTGLAVSVEIVGACVRISYTNGGTQQGVFRLFSSLKTN